MEQRHILETRIARGLVKALHEAGALNEEEYRALLAQVG